MREILAPNPFNPFPIIHTRKKNKFSFITSTFEHMAVKRIITRTIIVQRSVEIICWVGGNDKLCELIFISWKTRTIVYVYLPPPPKKNKKNSCLRESYKLAGKVLGPQKSLISLRNSV